MKVLPKILQAHNIEENRPFEEQLNEAKRILSILSIVVSGFFVSIIIIIVFCFLISFYSGTDTLKDIAQIVTSLQLIAFIIYLFASLIHSCKKATEEAISHK